VKSAIRKRPRPSQFLHGIDMWAFLSVEVTLLIILMMSGPPPHGDRSPVDSAYTDHATAMPGALREDAMRVAVTRDGNVFFGSRNIQPDDLPPLIQKSVAHGSERKVYLRVDTRAKYGDAAIVIDQVRQAGIQHIGIITQQRQPSRP
jgi:biopolymer transport protein TolR